MTTKTNKSNGFAYQSSMFGKVFRQEKQQSTKNNILKTQKIETEQFMT